MPHLRLALGELLGPFFGLLVGAAKQAVTSATGMIVMASNDDTDRYWHADLSLGSS